LRKNPNPRRSGDLKEGFCNNEARERKDFDMAINE